MGPRSDFSKPCQGAAEKSANATRCCCLARGSQCVGMSTKKDAARPFGLGTFFVVGGTELEQHGHAAGGVTNTPVGCLLVRGSQCVGMSTKKDAARPFGQGLFVASSTNPRRSRTVQNSNSTCRAQRRQSKPQCNDDDRSQRLKQGGVVGAAF